MEVAKRVKERDAAKKLQKFVKKKLFYRRFELNTRICQLLLRKSTVYKEKLLWFKVLRRKVRKNWVYFAVFYVFSPTNHIIFKKILRISETFCEKLNKHHGKELIFFAISYKKQDVSLRNLDFLSLSLNKLFGLAALLQKKQKIELFKQIFEKIDDFSKKNPRKQPISQKKDSIIKKTMSIVNEKDEELSESSKKSQKSSTSSEKIEELHEEIEESFEKTPQKPEQFPYEIRDNYLEVLAEKSLKKYSEIRKNLETVYFLAKSKKIKPFFEKLKRVPQKSQKKRDFAEKSAATGLVHSFEKTDNKGRTHKIEVFVEKTADSLVFQGTAQSSLQKKLVNLPAGEKIAEFPKKLEKNVDFTRF